ncbi:hypothetical protein GCM10009767_10810 [Kocuria aegyptia]|uniref:Uncharacterized protein n=1 Tax=Kocuria aegyptia TaxID=330943 RepID=A0ABP4WID0_9MICC
MACPAGDLVTCTNVSSSGADAALFPARRDVIMPQDLDPAAEGWAAAAASKDDRAVAGWTARS